MANGAPTVSNGLVISGVTTSTNVSVASSVTATTYYGSGANLTGIDATKIITGNTQVQTIDTGSDGHVKVTTEGGERLRVTSTGVVGINTDASTNGSGAKLVVGGRVQSNNGGYWFAGASGAEDGWHVQDSGGNLSIVESGVAERLRIGSAGQLGIAGANYGTSGQVLTSQGASSPIQWATLTTGKVLQMTYKRGGVTSSSNSGGWTDSVESGLNVDITPLSATSRIIIQMHSVGGNTSSGRSYFLRLRRKVNNTGDTNVASFQIGDGSNGGMQSMALTHVDYDASSPFNTSHVRNYRIRFGQDGSGTARFDYATQSYIYAMEIA